SDLWQRDQLRKESIIPGAAKLSLQKDAFSPASRLLLDSLSQTVISVEQKAEALTQWLTEHGINVSTDSASLANLASQEEMFLNPQLKQVEKLQANYHRHNQALLADIDNQVKDSLNLIHRQAGQSRI